MTPEERQVKEKQIFDELTHDVEFQAELLKARFATMLFKENRVDLTKEMKLRYNEIVYNEADVTLSEIAAISVALGLEFHMEWR